MSPDYEQISEWSSIDAQHDLRNALAHIESAMSIIRLKHEYYGFDAAIDSSDYQELVTAQNTVDNLIIKAPTDGSKKKE